MTVVIDAGVVASALLSSGEDGEWALSLLAVNPLAAPHQMPAEAANVLRRAELAGRIDAQTAALAHDDLLDLRVELFSFEPFAARAWELRQSVTIYDAWYVALAEHLDAPLATLDLRLSRAPGPRCAFLTPR
ncbi:hypothetical protein GCM10027064_05420 [Microbacterium petrolearium]